MPSCGANIFNVNSSPRQGDRISTMTRSRLNVSDIDSFLTGSFSITAKALCAQTIAGNRYNAIAASAGWLPAPAEQICQHQLLGTPESPVLLQNGLMGSALGQKQCDQTLWRKPARWMNPLLLLCLVQTECPLSKRPANMK